MIIGISGLAGSGKDTAADVLVCEHGFVKVSFADPMKRICLDVYKFSFEQMWGPSSARNAPDERYPREHGPHVGNNCVCACCGIACVAPREPLPQCYLTPRFALQQLGSEWGRVCYPATWVDYLIDVATKLDVEGGHNYSKVGGVSHDWRPGDDNWKTSVVVPDVRFKNEIDALREIGAKLIRITRPGAGLSGAAGQHRSETEQNNILDALFDAVLVNSGTLEQLERIVSDTLNMLA